MAEETIPAPGANRPVLTLLSDHPILPAGSEDRVTRDMLDLHERLLAPLDILRHPLTRTPFTIALYGDWGTGKTSAMRWLDQQIQIWNESDKRNKETHPHLTTVWFYPWKYHKREDVWRGIIAEVILESLRVKGGPDLPNRLAKAGKQFGKFLGHSFLHALSNIKFDAKAFGTGAEISGQAFKEIYEEYQQTARPHTPFLNDFESQLSEWVRSTFDDKTHRLVLFIDDLDRCLPEVTLEVLEALKLYLNIPGLLFVAGLDRGVIDQIVTDHYKKSGVQETVALHYLDKIFQVEIDVAPSQTKVSTFLDRKIAQLNEATGSLWSENLERPEGEDGHPYKKILEDAVRRLGRHNPREFTRILNSMLITAHAACSTTPRQADQMADEAARCLRFAQGAQVYLLRRLLHDYAAKGEYLLRTEDGQEWLKQFSEIRIANPELPPPYVNAREMIKEQPAALRNPSEVSLLDIGSPHEVVPDSAPADHCADLLARARRIDHASDAFKSIAKYGWDLMLIPFEPSVAAAMPKETTKPIASKPEKSPLADFPEEILSAIARSLGIPIQELAPQHLLAVENLDLSDSGVSNVTPLQGLANLQWLYLNRTQVSDVTPLQGLANLQRLDLVRTQVSDVTPLQGLANLQRLDLDGTQVGDVKPLQGLANLQRLSLIDTEVIELKPLQGLANLAELYLEGTQVSDVTPLQGLANLQRLSLIGTQVSDLKPLQGLGNLQRLHLNRAQVSDVKPLQGLANLQRLFLSGTQVSDVTPLQGLANLQRLSLSGTQVSDVTPLQGLANLAELYLEGTQVSDVTPLHGLGNLQWLDLSGTQVSDVKPLQGLANLQRLYLTDTPAGTDRASVSALKKALPNCQISA